MFSPTVLRRTPDHASRNDHEQKCADPVTPRYPTEASLRLAFRALIRWHHGKDYATGVDVRRLREEHTASVRRERASMKRMGIQS